MLALLGLAVMTQDTSIPDHVATRPADRMSEQWWKDRHNNAVEVTKAGNVDIVFLGDSITQGWESTGKATWDRLYASKRVGNFGFSGDRTEHVLWRLDNGEIIGLHPRLIVIMIGTNNVGHGSSTPAQTIDGTRAILARLRKDIPKAKILLLGIFPRGEEPNDPMRQKVVEATEGYKALADGKNVVFLDISRAFTYADGRLKTLLMPDRLHLSPGGYDIWAQAMDPTIQRMLAGK